MKTIIFGVDIPGYASIVVILLFFNGLNLLGIRIVGEYLARVFIEVKNRSLWLVRKRYGFDDSTEQPANGR